MVRLSAAGETAEREKCLAPQQVLVFPGRHSHEQCVALDVDHRRGDGGGNIGRNFASLFGHVDQFAGSLFDLQEM